LGSQPQHQSHFPQQLESHLTKLGLDKTEQHRSTNSLSFIYPHPYKFELYNLQFPIEQLQPKKETLYPHFEETKCTWINKLDQVEELIRILKGRKEFAVDLEHHSYR